MREKEAAAAAAARGVRAVRGGGGAAAAAADQPLRHQGGPPHLEHPVCVVSPERLAWSSERHALARQAENFLLEAGSEEGGGEGEGEAGGAEGQEAAEEG